ncbi:MAG: helix-turn-helix transcriptional regulator [Symploca sp. SIO2G7]|nr:helix-turn-helix transcriptional regulator [Symploca sp. SIO2G7]
MITLEEKLKQFTSEEQEQIYSRAEEMKKEVLILKAVCKATGISQEELADSLELSQSYVSRLERRSNVTINTILAVVKALEGSIDITINLPEREPVKFSQIETMLSSNELRTQNRESV